MLTSLAGAPGRARGFRAMLWRAGGSGRAGRGRAVRSPPDAWHRAGGAAWRRAALALVLFALPAAAQDNPAPFVTVMPPPSIPPAVLDAVQRMPSTAGLEAPLRAAPCVFAPEARHLERLPANMPWARPDAVVLFNDLPGLAAGSRAAVLRPTRELLARAATRGRIAEGDITLHGIDLSPLPADSPAPAFLAIHIAPPATPPDDCVPQGPH